MAYQTPKVDWNNTDIPVEIDFNRVEGNIEYIKNNTHEKSEVYTKLETSSTSEIDNKDQAILTQAKEYTDNLELEVDTKDQAILTEAKAYTDEQGGGGDEPVVVDKADIRGDDNVLLVIEVRADDPGTPAVGRIWLNTSIV